MTPGTYGGTALCHAGRAPTPAAGREARSGEGLFQCASKELSLNFNEPVIVACSLTVNPPHVVSASRRVT